ncbi:MAG TPA: S41 family peptidase [Ramlibacter sp.]|nr:S41 family peptidase [Ramlibacter sp.]
MAACLVFLGSAALAASPEPANDEEAIASVQDAYARAVTPGEQADLHRELIASVLQRVQRSHANTVDLAALATAATRVLDPLPPNAGDPAETFKTAISEALRALDPYSRYVDARSWGVDRGDATNAFGGLGLEVESSDGAVRVVAPMPGSPAARAGVMAGDLIVRVDEQSLRGVALADAIARMRGEPGTAVSLTVQRAGAASEITLSVTRDIIRRQLLRWKMEGDVLVLRISGFNSAVAASLSQAVTEATNGAQPRAIILDLRGNPGGLLREAVKVADAFLASGEIVSLRTRGSAAHRSWQADADELLAGLAMVVLIDRRSASASELVADALQHHGRATVMGQQSFGKGSVQTTMFLGEQKGALRLTTSLYHGPSGQTVHGVGVAPDIELLASGPSRSEQTPSRARARVEQARCASPQVDDAALSCALSYLRAGDVKAFVARMGDAPASGSLNPEQTAP